MSQVTSQDVKELTGGVAVVPITEDIVDMVRKSKMAETMVAKPGHGIKEHKHGVSSYFAKNADVTINGEKYILPSSALVHIPEDVSHGWQHPGKNSNEAIITSFDPGHDTFELYSLKS